MNRIIVVNGSFNTNASAKLIGLFIKKNTMDFLSLEPFIPSGPDFEKSKQLFLELGFDIAWEQQGMAGFHKGNSKFILQDYNNKSFAENLMVSVKVDSIREFWEMVSQKNLPGKFGIPAIRQPVQQPYGKEVNMIDIAGVCWHFIEA